MYLTEPNFKRIFWNQYVFKMKALSGVFISLILVQLFAFLLSLDGTGGYSADYGNFVISVKFFSGDLISVLTLWWAVIAGFGLTLRSYRETDFLLVTNRATGHLSMIALLLTASLYAGITTPLLGFFLRLVVYWRNMNVVIGEVAPPLDQLLMSLPVTACYAALFSCLGYAAGMLFHYDKGLLGILIGGYIALLSIPSTNGFILNVHRFYNAESSVLLFIAKVVLTVCLVYAFIIILTNRMEVRQ